jgi:Fe-S-cluster containining protein
VTDGAKTKKKAKKKVKKIQCDKCDGLCCRYFALPIEDPEDWDDFDDIRWYLCHENIDVFLEDGDWYMNVRNKCKHLSEKDYKCDMYEKRPKICRGYKMADCDYTSADYGYELHFKNDRQMEEYMKIKFGEKVLDKLVPKKKKKKRKAKDKRQKA